MRSQRAFQGLIATIVLPFLIALFFASARHYGLWSPKVLSSGHVYSPALVYERAWADTPQNHWTLLVVTSGSDPSFLNKWAPLPEFFPASPLKVEPIDLSTLNPALLSDLQSPLTFSIATPGTLFLVDSRGFIAMSFAPTVVVQDVLKDLKKILPKHPVRRAA